MIFQKITSERIIKVGSQAVCVLFFCFMLLIAQAFLKPAYGQSFTTVSIGASFTKPYMIIKDSSKNTKPDTVITDSLYTIRTLFKIIKDNNSIIKEYNYLLSSGKLHIDNIKDRSLLKRLNKLGYKVGK